MNVPILIPVKTHSNRCPGKNVILIKTTLEYLQIQNSILPNLDVRILTDSNIFNKYKSVPFIKDIWIEKDKNNYQSELESIYKYITLNHIDNYIQLNVTQPFRDYNLIQNAVSYSLNEYDLITSYSTYTDRSIFEIENDSFKIKNIPRTGSACPERKVADGAIYYTSKKFLEKCIKALNPNLTFWNSNIKFVENNAPLMDIDTKSDLLKFITFYGDNMYNRK